MSVIKQPGVLGQTTRQRLLGLTAAAAIAVIEAVAVGLWFLLVAVGPRTVSTALAGLGVLLCGSLLRACVFGLTTDSVDDVAKPRRLITALALAASWIVWLLVAEQVGGTEGLLAGGVALAVILTGQFALERRAFDLRSTADDSGGSGRLRGTRRSLSAMLPGVLVAVGATTLLAVTWFLDWTITTEPLGLVVTTVAFQIDSFQVGLITFCLFAFLAYQWRFRRTLEV